MNTKVPLLKRIVSYLVKRKGKQMRPIFVFLVAKMISSENFGSRTYRGASLIELIHTGSLIHDDVVDDSNKRRGFFSLNALWKNKIAVLVGDFLFSKSLLLSLENEDFDLLKIVSESLRDMTEGELLQLEKTRTLKVDETTYYEIIQKKTATLISSCCAIGAASVGGSEKVIDDMKRFGSLVGMAFQIKDDLFDYTVNNLLVGKPTSVDIKEQKITLPMIYVLNKASKEERKWLINSIKKHHHDKKRVRAVMDFVRENGGIQYATSKMNEFCENALALLKNYPHSPYKESLESLVNYVVERKK
jgi:octaprenyl-diphosphate synthase